MERDNVDSPEVWGIIWLVVAAAFGAGEIAIAGSFFLMPFAIGALLAAVASLLGAPILVGWLLFLVGTGGSFLALKPLAAKLDAQLPNPTGFGANRLIGADGVVIMAIPGGLAEAGRVKVSGEEWLATGANGMGVAVGTPVTITAVEGTRVVVQPSVTHGLGPLGSA